MILEDIVESTKERVETNKKRHSIYELKEKAFAMPIDQSFPFKKALEKDGMSYILEVKRHSPSKGQIVSTFDFKAIAKEYEMIGADAISVVTEPDYFKGDDDFLREIKRIVKIPVLRKDFVVDEYMVYESKILGADAILLIAGVLDEITLMRCVNLAHNLGMSAIVETHSSMQVKKALRVGAKIIGVNNRDLRDFSVDLNTTLKLRDMVDDDVIFVSESGIKTREDIELLEKHRVNGVLIGETMMKSHDKRHTLEVLKGIDFEIEKGEICVLLGPSGSGKSTLLNIIGGIDQPDSGTITIQGKTISTLKDLTNYRRKHLGYVFQMYNLISHLNVEQNIDVGKYLSKNPLNKEELLQTLGLKEHRYKQPNQLSGGQQQRTSIGRAIIKNPDLLLCDEPTGALDYHTSKDILQLIEDVNKKYGNTIIIVTHNDAIKDMADRVIYLHDGRIRENIKNTHKIPAKDLNW